MKQQVLVGLQYYILVYTSLMLIQLEPATISSEFGFKLIQLEPAIVCRNTTARECATLAELAGLPQWCERVSSGRAGQFCAYRR